MTTPNPHDATPDASSWEEGEPQELAVREVSFRRRPPEATSPDADEATPDQPAEALPVPSDEPVSAPEQSGSSPDPVEKVPFYKREISIRRKREAGDVTAAAATAQSAEPAPAGDPPATPGANGEPGADSVRATGAAGPTATATAARKGRGRSGQSSVGIKIGATSVSVAVVEQESGVSRLTTLFRRPLPPGVVSDGEVRDQAALAQELSTIWNDAGLPRRGVRLGLFGSRIGVRPVDIVGIEEAEQFANAARFKAHEVLPIGVHESVLDFRVLGEYVNESGERVRRTLLVVAPRDQVMSYVGAFRTARIGLEAVDIDALALVRAFVDPGEPGLATAQDSAAVVVSMDREGSTLVVAGGGTCDFTRAFDWSGNMLAAAIAEQFEVSPEEAWSLLEAVMRRGAVDQPLEDENQRAAAELVRARLVPFARELVSSLQFYQQQQGSLGIADIVVTGAIADVPGVADALHQLIGVGVRVGDPFARLIVRGALTEGVDWTASSMAIPVGLATRDLREREIDLIPPDQRVKIRWRPRLAPILLPAAAAIPIAAMGIAYFQAKSDVTDRNAQLDEVQAEFAALPQPKAVIDSSLSGKAVSRAQSVAALLGGRLAWNSVLTDFSRVLPRDVWLTSLTADLPDPAVAATAAAGTTASPAPAGPSTVTITGKTFSFAGVAQLLSRLSTLPALSDVQLTSSAFEDTELPGGQKVRVVSFTVTASVDPPGGS